VLSSTQWASTPGAWTVAACRPQTGSRSPFVQHDQTSVPHPDCTCGLYVASAAGAAATSGPVVVVHHAVPYASGHFHRPAQRASRVYRSRKAIVDPEAAAKDRPERVPFNKFRHDRSACLTAMPRRDSDE